MDMDAAADEIASDLGVDVAESSEDTPNERPINSSAMEPVEADHTSETSSPPADSEAKSGVTEPAPKPSDAPRTWRPEAASKWSMIDPTIQAEILKREDDIFKGLEGYKEQATFGKNVKSAIDPYLPILRQYNIDPIQQISGLMEAHKTLALGSAESKIHMFQRLAKDYNVDLAQVFNNEQDQQYIDPQVKTLSEQLNMLQQNLQARDRVEHQRTQQQVSEQIDKFASDSKSHPYFDEVGQNMADLLQSGVAKTLDNAYEQAVWANPITRAKELSRITAVSEAKKQEEDAKKVADARKATSANVKTTAKSGSATAPLGSMDDTLMETLSKIRSRG